MSKRLKNTWLMIRQAGIHVPVTWYFMLFLLFGWLGFSWLLNQQQLPGSSFSDVLSLLMIVTAACIATLLLFALLSVTVSFLFFFIKKRRGLIHCSLESTTDETAARQRQVIRLHITPLLRPLLGFVRLRLVYDHRHYSAKFALAETGGRKKNTLLEGTYSWPLPQIREYAIRQVIVYFEDMFQFFSFTVALDSRDRFFTRPDHAASRQLVISPRKTEETNVHIEELKKVESEHLNYKHFEANDDVRRIVWKIYAKNKELVVRTPEVLDPYASHLCLYASFYTAFDVTGSTVVEQPFLDYYKTVIYNTYRQLVKQGFEVQYIPDQSITTASLPDAQQITAYQVSTSHWQTQQPVTDYIRPEEASVVILSSLSDAEEVARLVGRYGNSISFMLVRLSKGMKQHHIGHWLQWLFIKPEKYSYDKHKPAWQLSPLRGKLMANEKNIAKLLAAYEKSVVI